MNSKETGNRAAVQNWEISKHENSWKIEFSSSHAKIPALDIHTHIRWFTAELSLHLTQIHLWKRYFMTHDERLATGEPSMMEDGGWRARTNFSMNICVFFMNFSPPPVAFSTHRVLIEFQTFHSIYTRAQIWCSLISKLVVWCHNNSQRTSLYYCT